MRAAVYIVLLALLAGCGKEDSEAPNIVRLTLNQSEASSWFDDAGETVDITLTASDNQELNQYKMSMVTFDDQQLPDDIWSDSLKIVGNWDWVHIGELAGESDQVSVSLSIPQEVVGERFLIAQVIDHGGNQSDVVARRLVISNDFIPTLSVDFNAGSHDGFQTVSTNNPVIFSGSVSDVDGLQSVGADLYDGSGTRVWFVRYAVNGAESIDLATLPISFSTAPTGVYTLSLVATDSQGFENCVQTLCVVI